MRLRLLPATIVATLTRGLARIVGRAPGCSASSTDMGPVAEPAAPESLSSAAHRVSPARAADIRVGATRPSGARISVGDRANHASPHAPVRSVSFPAGSASSNPPAGGSLEHRLLQGAIVALVIWAIAETTSTLPHQLAYANQLAGGPENCWQHLHVSSCNWGQNLLFVRDFQRRESEQPCHTLRLEWMLYPPEPIGVISCGSCPPATVLVDVGTWAREQPRSKPPDVSRQLGYTFIVLDPEANEKL